MALIDPDSIALAPEPLSLPVLDPARQQAVDTLLPALDGAILELASGVQYNVKARLLDASEIAGTGPWLTGSAAEPALHFRTWERSSVLLHAERVADIAAMLTSADALLAALERRIGVTLEPDQLRDTAPDDAHILTLDFHDAQGLQHQLTLAFPADFACPADSAQQDLNLTRATVTATLECVVAALDVDDASTIGRGDLLILRGGHWSATLGTAFGAVSGRFDPFHSFFSVGTGDPAQDQYAMSDEDTGGDGGFGALKVPVSVKLPDQGLTIEELGRLRAGLAVPVGPIAAGLEVQLMVAGRTIAIGELVRLGDQFAVHIDRIPQDSLPAATDATGDTATDQAIEMPDQSGAAPELPHDDMI